MTKKEWLEIGYEKNIIDTEDYEEILFCQAYKRWFKMKLNCIKAQTCDRIEVTYNRYYKGTSLVEKCISKITETDIIDFLTQSILRFGNVTGRELKRVIQIVHNVLVYCKDMKIGGACLYDWDKIKRYLPSCETECEQKECAVSPRDIGVVMDSVIRQKIYYEKHSACLCLCMNFYLGLRIGELASLTFKDFDFDRNVVKIFKTESKCYKRDDSGEKQGSMVYEVHEDTKTIYSVREIPIMPEVKQIYDLIVKHHQYNNYQSPYLAYDGKDTILIRSLDRTLRRLCRLCGVEYFNSHVIRKTFATVLHFSGVPTRVISDLMGHSEISTTENNYILSYRDNYDSIYGLMHGALNYGTIA